MLMLREDALAQKQWTNKITEESSELGNCKMTSLSAEAVAQKTVWNGEMCDSLLFATKRINFVDELINWFPLLLFCCNIVNCSAADDGDDDNDRVVTLFFRSSTLHLQCEMNLCQPHESRPRDLERKGKFSMSQVDAEAAKPNTWDFTTHHHHQIGRRRLEMRVTVARQLCMMR